VEIIKAAFRDIVIIGGFLVTSCLISKSAQLVGGPVAFVVFWATVPIAFLLLFFSHGVMLKKIRNDHVWAMAAGVPSLIVLVPAVIFAVHSNC